jgi:hypothetical protein
VISISEFSHGSVGPRNPHAASKSQTDIAICNLDNCGVGPDDGDRRDSPDLQSREAGVHHICIAQAQDDDRHQDAERCSNQGHHLPTRQCWDFDSMFYCQIGSKCPICSQNESNCILLSSVMRILLSAIRSICQFRLFSITRLQYYRITVLRL